MPMSGESQPSPPSLGGYPWSPPTFGDCPPGFATPPQGSDSAPTALHSLSLLFTCLLVSLQVANHI
ncbi:hypothetical protein L195_g027021 [Trifolium pratense]|uniref:Uncharacterized protein n=2 Tax=Trifolium pratense TaxID=57577 RepID=A0A2K3KXY7_TRIPR|nr:hypothetical protein L195_g027021 [Trifolium pratense]